MAKIIAFLFGFIVLCSCAERGQDGRKDGQARHRYHHRPQTVAPIFQSDLKDYNPVYDDPWKSVCLEEKEGFVLPLVPPLANQELSNPDQGSQRNSFTNQNQSMPVMCGNYLLKHGDSVRVSSPNYPEKYPNFYCSWSFQVPVNETSSFQLNCTYFNLGLRDFLEVQENFRKERYRKNYAPKNSIFHTDTLTLNFYSSRRTPSQGFSCFLEVLSETEPSTTEGTMTTISITRSEATAVSTTMHTTYTSTTPTTSAPTPTNPPTDRPQLSRANCGLANARIVNGVETLVNEFPWQVYLQVEFPDKARQVCGGSLITEHWILTAGHCLMRQQGGDQSIPIVFVVLTMHRRSRPLANGGIIMKTSKLVVHPENSFAYDMALIKLEKNVTFSSTLSPICLPYRSMASESPEGTEFIMTGWGKTADGKLSDELRKVSRPGISNSECTKVFGTYITDHHMCTSGKDFKHICQGDSGGPVMTLKEGRYFLAGVVSFVATKDCSGEYPDGHSFVAGFLDWIESVIEQRLY